MPARRPTSRQIRSSRRVKALLLDMACQPPSFDDDDPNDAPLRLHDLWFRPIDPFTQAHFEDR